MYVIYNGSRGSCLIEGFVPILEHEGLDSIWYEQQVFTENGTEEIGFTGVEIFDTLGEAIESKKELEKLSWDALDILKVKHSWVFQVDYTEKVPQGFKLEE